MNRHIFFTVIIFVIAVYLSFKAGELISQTKEASNIELGIPIKKLLAYPDESAKVVYEIPIEVKLLERTPDKRWYKARIAFDFLGHYQYDGWCKVVK